MELPLDLQPYPDAFYPYIKQILENLYDFPYLNRHPLAKYIQMPRTRPAETDGQRLRRVIIAAIEELKPAEDSAARSSKWRYHRLLHLRYAESHTVQEVARELGISERQTYRDMKRAEESLAAHLWERLSGDLAELFDTPVQPVTPFDPGAEMEAAALQYSVVPAQDLLYHACRAVERLAEQQGIGITAQLPAESLPLYTIPSLAQQVLISLLSSILQNAAASSVSLGLERSEATAFFHFTFDLSAACAEFDPGNRMINQMVERLGWKMSAQTAVKRATQTVTLEVNTNEAIVLVIDDNTALIELFRRYLTNTRCEVIGVNDGAEGLNAAKSLRPNVILLDVMMPSIDGWEILQRLKANPETAAIPVVVCSIFNDPVLAASLGAESTLPKPVKREALFDLLHRLLLF